MTQPDLFTGEPEPREYRKGGMLYRDHGTWEERNFKGYRQSRYKGELWRFYVAWFTGKNESIGRVLMFDRTLKDCPMDSNNRLKIDGKWYGPEAWDH